MQEVTRNLIQANNILGPIENAQLVRESMKEVAQKASQSQIEQSMTSTEGSPRPSRSNIIEKQKKKKTKIWPKETNFVSRSKKAQYYQYL